jgi:hypothetical protein
MSELQPLIQDDVVLDIDEPVVTPEQYTMEVYQDLLARPVQTLINTEISINGLPAVPDGTEADMWFAAARGAVVIDEDCDTAWRYVGAESARSATQKKMVISKMRGFGLTRGTLQGERYGATGKVDTGAITADLWVTEVQSGCTVLILDWGADEYSMVHLQPSEDNQFNWAGQLLMGLGGYTSRVTGPDLFKNLYKNSWLSRESNRVVGTTGGTPNRYIMVQSMFEASRSHVTQVIGIRAGRTFNFFRQIPIDVRTRRAEALRWSTWYIWLPFFSY